MFAERTEGCISPDTITCAAAWRGSSSMAVMQVPTPKCQAHAALQCQGTEVT